MKTPKEIVYLNDAQIIPPEWDNKKRDWKPEEIKIKIHNFLEEGNPNGFSLGEEFRPLSISYIIHLNLSKNIFTFFHFF